MSNKRKRDDAEEEFKSFARMIYDNGTYATFVGSKMFDAIHVAWTKEHKTTRESPR